MVCYLAIALAATMATSGTGGSQQRWSAEKANEWHKQAGWLVGFNYVPSTAANDTEMWQKDTFDLPTIDRELAWAQGIGFNSCRVFLQYIVWKQDPTGFKKRLAQFLAVAKKRGLSVMPVLFDDCAFDANRDPYLAKQDDPQPGVHNSRWVPSPGLKVVTDKAEWPSLERYVKDVIGTYRNDKRVVFWDLYNEPGNSGMGNKSLPLVESAFGWARDAKPSQPLTVGVWGGTAELAAKQIELSDIVSFHFYGGHDAMKAKIDENKKLGWPVVCTEWMARTLGSNIQTDMPLFKEAGVGCFSWGLVAGKTQTRFPWGSALNAPEPAVWFHDLLRPDGAPQYPDEIAFIKRLTNAPGVGSMKPLFDYPVRDTCVCLGGDGNYYLIGTTGAPTWWKTNEGMQMWRSKDLHKWEPMGFVWTFAKNTTWQTKRGEYQAIWAPELHYIKGNYYIAYCLSFDGGGTGILKSTSGKPEGPYVDVKPEAPVTDEIDSSFFQDDDGKVYFVYQNGKIARMKDDMSGLAEKPRMLVPENAPQVGFEGAFIFKANGRYYLSCADFIDGRYHCYVASSPHLFGPYGPRYLAVPHGGHNMFFKDKKGQWWSTFFGNDGDAPFRERPAILPIEFGLDGEPRPLVNK